MTSNTSVPNYQTIWFRFDKFWVYFFIWLSSKMILDLVRLYTCVYLLRVCPYIWRKDCYNACVCFFLFCNFFYLLDALGLTWDEFHFGDLKLYMYLSKSIKPSSLYYRPGATQIVFLFVGIVLLCTSLVCIWRLNSCISFE